MARTKNRATDGDITLRRVSEHYLEIDGLTHSAPRPSGVVCGGQLRVKDWRPTGVRRDPYEIFCEKCVECCMDGCQRIDEILPAAKEWFES